MKKTIMVAAVIPALAVSLAACHGTTHTASHVRAHASVMATSTSAAYARTQAQDILHKCMPAQNALTELEWARNITAGKHSKDYAQGEVARQAFEGCAGVNPANDAKFQAQVEKQGGQVLAAAAHDEATGNRAGAKALIKNFAENQVEQDAVADR